jgi:hypothetical protein
MEYAGTGWLILNSGSSSSFTPMSLCPKIRRRSTHWRESWVGPRAGLDDLEKRKHSCLCRELNYNSLTVQPVACEYRNTYGKITRDMQRVLSFHLQCLLENIFEWIIFNHSRSIGSEKHLYFFSPSARYGCPTCIKLSVGEQLFF